MRDFNDAQRVFANGSLSGFTETSPFVGITDAGLVPGGGTGPIGWETYQPETQLWLYKYYGDTETMRESFNSTYAYIQLLDSNPSGIGHGLGDWMPVVGTSTEFTGPGFLRMSCEYRLSLSLFSVYVFIYVGKLGGDSTRYRCSADLSRLLPRILRTTPILLQTSHLPTSRTS